VWLAKPSLSETFTPSHLAGFPEAALHKADDSIDKVIQLLKAA
jgi:hypothetical protein